MVGGVIPNPQNNQQPQDEQDFHSPHILIPEHLKMQSPPVRREQAISIQHQGKDITMIVYLPLLIAIIGVLMYAFCTNTKRAEIGRLMFACGLLAFLLTSSHLLTLVK